MLIANLLGAGLIILCCVLLFAWLWEDLKK